MNSPASCMVSSFQFSLVHLWLCEQASNVINLQSPTDDLLPMLTALMGIGFSLMFICVSVFFPHNI